jgi:hypothetical protein
MLFSSCATVLQGRPDKIPVASDPPGAEVLLNGAVVGRTPMTLAVPHSADCYIEVRKDGYQSSSRDVKKVAQGGFVLSLFFPLAAVIDLATHNQGKYPEIPHNFSLAPIRSVAKEAD